MSTVDDILAQVPIGSLAARLGVDPAVAEKAARQALPALLGGIGANAKDPAGAQSVASAVQDHDPSLVDGEVDLSKVDTADGEKIVGNVFGTNRDAIIQQLGGQGGQISPALLSRILPVLAPIVMSYLAKRAGTGGAGGPAATGSGGLGDLLGSLLNTATQGGGQQGTGQAGAQQGSASAGGSISDLLGSLLGAGRR